MVLPLRALGATGLMVSSVAVGCAVLGDMTETFGYSVPEDRALETLRAAFASPFRFIDTAAAYGDGESERRIGLVIRELGGVPPGYVLSTKADCPPKEAEPCRWSPSVSRARRLASRSSSLRPQQAL